MKVKTDLPYAKNHSKRPNTVQSVELVCIELNWLTFTEIMRPEKELRMSEAFLFPSFSRGDSNLANTL